MCGIKGYIGPRLAAPLLTAGLQVLAYRGYCSAGFAVLTDAEIYAHKCAGDTSPEDLHAFASASKTVSTVGIAHTRWATHGAPTVQNSHPHLSQNKRVAIVHNGVIENHRAIREALLRLGYQCSSETDSEVLAHLIERELGLGANSLADAVDRALDVVEGTYALAVISLDHPDEIVAARKSSPLIVGVGQGELYLTSDELSLADKDVGVAGRLEDGMIVTLHRDGRVVSRKGNLNFEKISIAPDAADLGGNKNLMIREINEQPESLQNALRGHIDHATGTVKLGCFTPEVVRQLRMCDRIIMVGCGTSYCAGLQGALMIERIARVPVTVVLASEFLYSMPIITGREVFFFISQSGETADTLGALRLVKKAGALCLGITNRVGSTLAREVEGGTYLHAGPERAVASTKAFTSQVAVLALYAMKIAEVRGTSDPEWARQMFAELEALPGQIQAVLKDCATISKLARDYRAAKRIIVLGRGFTTPLAYEAALKLKEIPYIDAHGYAAGELKHGPLALVEDGVPVIAIVPNGVERTKMLSNMAEVKTRGGHVIAITYGVDEDVKAVSTAVIAIPVTKGELVAITAAPVLQLLAYYLGLERECNIDRPRNLAKSVTVE